ncbi:Wzz/FepE/Etk N-terminal domain-containing protein [Malaciobacter mytili]|uniref:Wzz/FepE/Etk N-terminal domain-containing protein n=1 Tax=Malaciobacter mytili TaxID=603050 RepID=UPI003A87C5AA
MQQNEYIENKDIIDLKKIFKIIYKNIRFVLLFTSFVVIVAIIYIFIKKPIYQVESNIQIGHIENNLIARPEVLSKNVQLYFKVKDTEQNSKSYVSELTKIRPFEIMNFITIQTQAYTNEEALKKNQEVVYYIQNLYQDKIEQYKTSIKTQIEINKAKIIAIEKFQKQDLQEQIEILKKEKSSLTLLDSTL